MTQAEMNRRIAEMDPKVVERIREMVRLGYGVTGISLETPATIKQVNAVFALARGAF